MKEAKENPMTKTILRALAGDTQAITPIWSFSVSASMVRSAAAREMSVLFTPPSVTSGFIDPLSQ